MADLILIGHVTIFLFQPNYGNFCLQQDSKCFNPRPLRNDPKTLNSTNAPKTLNSTTASKTLNSTNTPKTLKSTDFPKI